MAVTDWGGEFQVNTTTSGNQKAFYNHAVAALPNGRFVVTYESNDNGDGDGTCIRARMFEADGTPVGLAGGLARAGIRFGLA